MASSIPFASSPVQLVLLPAGFMAPRLLLVPASTGLPAGVRAVAASARGAKGPAGFDALVLAPPATLGVPAAAAPGSGRRGALVAFAAAAGNTGAFVLAPAADLGVLPAVAAAAAPGSGHRAAAVSFATAGAGSGAGKNGDDDDNQTTDRFAQFIQAQGDAALGLLSELVPHGADCTARYEEMSKRVAKLVAMAKAGEEDDHLGCAISLVRAAYTIVRVAHICYPHAGLPSLPDEQAFIALFLGTDPKEPVVALSVGDLTPLTGFDMLGDEEDAVLIKGVLMAITTATSAARTARFLYGCGGRAGAP